VSNDRSHEFLGRRQIHFNYKQGLSQSGKEQLENLWQMKGAYSKRSAKSLYGIPKSKGLIKRRLWLNVTKLHGAIGIWKKKDYWFSLRHRNRGKQQAPHGSNSSGGSTQPLGPKRPLLLLCFGMGKSCGSLLLMSCFGEDNLAWRARKAYAGGVNNWFNDPKKV